MHCDISRNQHKFKEYSEIYLRVDYLRAALQLWLVQLSPAEQKGKPL